MKTKCVHWRRINVNDTERSVLDLIDTDALLEYLRELVSIPSYRGEESDAQRSVATKFEELGLEVKTTMCRGNKSAAVAVCSTTGRRAAGSAVGWLEAEMGLG